MQCAIDETRREEFCKQQESTVFPGKLEVCAILLVSNDDFYVENRGCMILWISRIRFLQKWDPIAIAMKIRIAMRIRLLQFFAIPFTRFDSRHLGTYLSYLSASGTERVHPVEIEIEISSQSLELYLNNYLPSGIILELSFNVCRCE